MNRVNCVSIRMLGLEWRHRMIDVCGVGVFKRTELRDVFITHLHLDHLPLTEYIYGAKLRFFTASIYISEVAAKYGDMFEVCEYNDVAEVRHTSRHGNRFVMVPTIIFFFKDVAVIPEVDDPDGLIREYAPRYAFLFVSRQSHSHPASFNNRRRDVFIVDNNAWRPYAPNIVPKIVFSCTGEDRELFSRFYAGRRF